MKWEGHPKIVTVKKWEGQREYIAGIMLKSRPIYMSKDFGVMFFGEWRTGDSGEFN